MSEENAVQRQTDFTNQSFEVEYSVQLIPQLTNMSCWAAGAAMLVSWRDNISINPDEIANATGYWEQYKDGLIPQDTQMFATWGLTPEPPQSYAVNGFAGLMSQYGPLWVAQQVDAPHILVVTGISGDGSPEGTTLKINDPWPPGGGTQYTLTYAQFASQQASLASSEQGLSGTPLYVAHVR